MKFEDEADLPVYLKQIYAFETENVPTISKIPATTKSIPKHKITCRAGDTYFTAAARKFNCQRDRPMQTRGRREGGWGGQLKGLKKLKSNNCLS